MLTSEQQSQRLSLALKGAKCGLWDWNLTDNTIYFDPNYFLISGYEPDGFPHHLDEWKKRVHPDDLALAERTTQQYLSGEIKAHAVEFRFKTKNGDWMWILGQGEISERDKDGTPVRFIGLHIDITERKTTVEALQESEEKYRSLYDNAPLSYQSLDEDGRFLDVNPAWLRTLGYNRDEVIGKNYADFLHPDWKPHFEKAFPAFKKRGYVNDVQFKIRHKDGHYIDISFEGCIGYTPDGKFKQTYCVFQDITERKQSENKLLESESRYRSLFQNNHSVMLLIDPETATIVDANPAACHYYGYDKETLLRIKITDINQQTEQQVLAELDSARKEHRNYFNFQHRLASGDIRDVEVYSGPIRIQGKDLLYSIINDITESKQTKKALLDSEAKLDSILRSAPIGIGQITNRKINFVNKNFAQMLGYSVQDLIGNNSRIVYPSDEEFERVGRYKYEEIKKKGTGSIDTVLQKKDGTLIDVFLSSTPVNPDDLSQGVTFTALDITERKEAEALLSNAAYEWRLIMDEFEDAIYLLDNDRRLLRGNTAFYKMIETTPEQAIGRHIVELIHPQCEKDPCPVCLAQEEKRDFIMVMEADDKNNPTGRPIEIKIKITRDEKGASTGILMNLHDLTQTRLNEEQRSELEKQLRQKHKMEAVGYMAGGMAHNFNNNLSIILGNVELSLMKQPVGSDVSPLLENAKIAVRRSRDLILKIITYSRKGSQQKAPMQLTTIIDETITLMQATMPSTVNLQKSYSPECDSIYIDADASQIQEVLINLCNNAIQAMDEKGKLKIHREPVELTQQEIPAQYDCLPGRYAKLSVQDSGCGMPAEMLDKIFDPFYTTKEEYEGAGMGLATVQGIVAQHGGIIKVSSTPGQGTTFNLYLPIIEQTHREGSIAENTTLPRGTERVLFVDDNEMLASLGKELLTEMGYQISVMTESTEALKMFTANADYFDLVITDQTMPDLCGEDLIHELKKVRPDIPTILCTGYSSRIDEERARELGISAFLMKPLDLPKLAQTVRNVLDGVEIE